MVSYDTEALVSWYTFPQNFVDFYRIILKFYDNNLGGPVVMKHRCMMFARSVRSRRPNSALALLIVVLRVFTVERGPDGGYRLSWCASVNVCGRLHHSRRFH